MSAGRKVYIKTYGCQMNVYDSQRMADALAPDGYAETATPEDADLVILNTCHIREKAAEKVYSELGRMRADEAGGGARRPPRHGRRRRLRGAGRGRRRSCAARRRSISWSGRRAITACRSCCAQADRGERVDRHRVPGRGQVRRARRRRAARRSRRRGVTAFLTVQEGCDKFCTFCVVPYTRGAEISRPVDRIVAEAERLAEAGVREITLLGQNVNAYHGEGRDGRAWTLGRLLHRLADMPGIARLRYTTSHPRDMDDDLIAAHRDLPALMPYLHLPVQSGSDRILEAMNRRHTRADYLARRSSGCAPRGRDIALSSDFIVGFPGRDRGRFRRHAVAGRGGRLTPAPTRSSIRRGPARRRPSMADQVAEDVKAERLQRLQQRDRSRSRPASTSAASARPSTCCSRSPAAIRARSSAARPTAAGAGHGATRR